MEELYLELLKKSLLGELYWENEVRLLCLRETLLRIDERRRAFCERYRELNGPDGSWTTCWKPRTPAHHDRPGYCGSFTYL